MTQYETDIIAYNSVIIVTVTRFADEVAASESDSELALPVPLAVTPPGRVTVGQWGQGPGRHRTAAPTQPAPSESSDHRDFNGPRAGPGHRTGLGAGGRRGCLLRANPAGGPGGRGGDTQAPSRQTRRRPIDRDRHAGADCPGPADCAPRWRLRPRWRGPANSLAALLREVLRECHDGPTRRLEALWAGQLD
jgi:hypothetical protein